MVAFRIALLCLVSLVFLHGSVSSNREPENFAIPFALDANNNPVYGDDKHAGDVQIPVTFSKDFKFGSRTFRTFYINVNGAIRTANDGSDKTRYVAASPYDQATVFNDIIVYGRDVGMTQNCTAADKTCGVFARRGSNIDQATKTAITNLVSRANMDYHMIKGDRTKVPPKGHFYPDPELTLVVTWYKAPQFSMEYLRNSFQAVITSDGTRSYAIFSYKSLTYPDIKSQFKAGVQYDNANQYCGLPVDTGNFLPSGDHRHELYCQSNAYQRGTYVIGLNDASSPRCFESEQNNKITATCADCQDTAITVGVNERNCVYDGVSKVCGRNEESYSSICDLRKAACAAFGHRNNNITFLNEGQCYVSPCKFRKGGCEDTCTVENGKAKCHCSDGKTLRNDGKGCDWSGYTYIGARGGIIISKDKTVHWIERKGSDIRTVAHDYTTNTLFFSEESMKNFQMEYEIRWYKPGNGTEVLLKGARVGGRVVQMMFDSTDSSLYYATENGQVRQIKDVYGDSPQVSDIHKFSSVSGMSGEGCQGYMFVVDSKDGYIYRLKKGELKLIIKNLRNASGLAIDYMNHKIYWSSDLGIEESNYDGSCRRNVSMRSMGSEHRPVYMYFFYDTLVYSEGYPNSVLRQVNVRTGVEKMIYQYNYPVYGIGMIWPMKAWSANRVQQRMETERPMGSIPTFKREFRIQFNFSATTDPQSLFNFTQSETSVLSANYESGVFHIWFNYMMSEGAPYNVSIPMVQGTWHTFEVGQSKEHGKFVYYVRMDNRLVHSMINQHARAFNGIRYSAAHMNFRGLAFTDRVANPFCPIKMTCGDKCRIGNGGCEEQCVPTATGTMCKCGDDKMLRSDGKSCDWRNYFYIGGHNSIHVANQFLTRTIPVDGTVTAVTSDYSSNTLFYATEKVNKGVREYSINAYQPRDTYRSVVDKSRLTSKVTQMMLNSAQQTIYFTTADGTIHTLTNFFNKNQSDVTTIFSNRFSAITGESCNGMMFGIGMNDGTIHSYLNETLKVVVSGLRNPKLLTIDHHEQMLYWYSDAGFEESRYDGSCRRLVAKASSLHGIPNSMVYTDALYWTNERMVKGAYNLMRTDIKTGVTTQTGGSTSPTPLTAVDYIYPEHRWNEKKRTMTDGRMDNVTMPKEFKIKFDFMSASERSGFSMMTASGVPEYPRPGLTIFFMANGRENNFTLPTKVNWTNHIEISQERSGSTYLFQIKLNNHVRYSVVNEHPRAMYGQLWGRRNNTMSSHRPQYTNMVVYTKASVVPCSNKKTCPVYCAAKSCEDTCSTSYASYPPRDTCSCSDGKGLKSDGKSCNWNGYMYMGGEYFFSVSKGKKTHVVITGGNVISMDHVYSRNTFYFILEQPTYPGYKYSLMSYNPRSNISTIIDDVGGRAEHVAYNMFNNYLFFAIGGSLKGVNLTQPTVENIHTFSTGNITGMIGEPCNKTSFILIGDEGAIYQLGTGIYNKVIQGLRNPRGLTIDYTNHKLIWASDDGLEEASYDGSCRRVIRRFGDDKPHNIYLAGRSLLWSNTANLSIHDTNVDTGLTKNHNVNSRIFTAGMVFDRSLYPDVCPIKMSCDIGSCKSANNGCEEKCVTIAGKAKCQCRTGKLKPDQKHCDYTGYMVYARNNTILMASATDHFEVSPPQGGSEIYAVEFDYENNNIFYSYKRGNKYYLARFNTSDDHVDLVDMGTDPSNKVNYLAFDFDTNTMYAARDSNVVSYSNIYSGSPSFATIANTRSNGIAYEPCGRRLYFSCMCHNGNRIKYYDVANRTEHTIVQDRADAPRALTLDSHTGKLYFVEGRTSTYKVYEVDYDGTCIRTVAPFNGEPYGFQVFGYIDTMYITDSIMRKDGYSLWNTTMSSHKTQLMYAAHVQNYDIKSIHNRKHLKNYCGLHNVSRECSACTVNNGGCEDKCSIDFVNGGVAKCHCSSGKLRADGKTCDHTGYVTFGSNHAITMASMSQTILQMVNGNVMGVEFDYAKNVIFYSVGSKIRRFNMKGEHKDLVEISSSFGPIEHLAFDWKTKDMYFTTKHYLHVARNIYQDPATAKNVTYFGRATGVVFDPCSQKVFVTCSASNALYAWHEGRPLETIMSGLEHPQALAIDIFEKQIYFFEKNRFTQTNYNGTCKNTIAKDLEGAEPYEAQVFGGANYIYWTDRKMKADGNYHLMNTTFDGKTRSVYKDAYFRNGVRIIFDRKLANYACTMKGYGGQCVAGRCRYNKGGCEDKCSYDNKIGKHRCECTHGVLKPDMKTCDYTNFVTMAMGNKVIMDDKKTKYVHYATSETRAIGFDYDTNTVFFSTAERLSSGQKSQLRSYDAKGVQKLILTSDFEITHIAYDAARKNLYYTTPYHLRMVNLYYPVPVVLDYIAHTNGLVFDPCENKVFVSSNNGVYVWQEGKKKHKLPISVKHPSALAIDEVKHKLYIFERRMGITQVNYDGSCAKLISYQPNDAKPYGMVYMPQNDQVMWSDLTPRDNMYSCMTTSVRNGTTKVMERSRQAMYALKRIYDRKYTGSCPTRYTCDTGVCVNNGGCEQMCSIGEKGAHKGKPQCHCKWGGQLRMDGKTCDYSKVVYVASGRYLLFRYGDRLERATIFHAADHPISGIAHRPDRRGIFFAVKKRNHGSSIYYKQVNMNKAMHIADKNVHIWSMDYDQQKDALFYSMANGEIQRMHNPLEAHRRDEYLLTAGMPHDIKLSYCNRELIYIDNMDKIGRVMSVKENERMPELITYGPGLFAGLAFDRQRNMLYWKNSKFQVINERTSGNCVREVVKADDVKFMVFRAMHLFYADGRGHIKCVNLNNGMKYSLGNNTYPITGGMRFFDNVTHFTTPANKSAGSTPRPTQAATTMRPMVNSSEMEKPGTVTPAPTPDQNGYVNGSDGHSYKFHSTAANWSAADAVCRSEGAHLAVIDSKATYEYVTMMLNSKKLTNWIWIGGHDKFSNNTWMWISGTPVAKTNWQQGEPNNYGMVKEDCMLMFPVTGARFYDADCAYAVPNFLCQKGGYLKGPEGYEYKVHTKKVNWRSAEATCVAEGGHLAVIDTPKTFEYMQQLAYKMKSWIWVGARDKFSNNTWKWVNGKAVGKKHWLKGEPNNYNGVREDCMAIYPATGAQFYDASCFWTEPIFVCQKGGIKPKAVHEMKDGYRQGYDGNFYKYFSEPKTWSEAQVHCKSEKAMLAMGKTDQDHMYMAQMYPNNYWIGANDQKMEGQWKWADGKSIMTARWSATVNEGKKGRRDCGYMKDGGQWNQAECTERKPYLCQRIGSFERCGGAQKCHPQILYPFGARYGDHALPRGDETYAHLRFEKGILFYSRMKTDLYIHTNGHITADKPDGRWTHSTESKMPVAAVYMMDLTTENGGDVFYRVTTDKVVLDRIAFEASRFPSIPKGYRPKYAIIVTWNEVHAKSDPTKKLTFQIAYHTDGNISASNTIYARLPVSGGMTGFTEGKCNQLFNTEASRQTSMLIVHYSNIGVNGIYLYSLYKPQCGVKQMSYPVEVKHMTANASMEQMQPFFYDGRNRIRNVFTQAYTGNHESVSFATGMEHKLDQVRVKFVYYTNAPFDYQWGVSTLILRDNFDETYNRRGKVNLPAVGNDEKCHYQMFKKSMDKSPCILLNAMIHSYNSNPLNGLSHVWLHNVSRNGFHICYQGMVDFWGPRSIAVDYMAVSMNHTGPANVSEMGIADFPASQQKKDGEFCKAVEFKHLYPMAPAVFVTVETNKSGSAESLAWVKDTKRAHAVICARNMGSQMSDMKVHYIVYQKMDKCSKHKCPAHLECHLDAKGENPSCGCKRNCSEYPQETFCASNFHTYKSKCEMEKQLCEMKTNATAMNVSKIYDGECKQYPYQTGKDKLEVVPALKSAFCKHIPLNSNNFHEQSPLKVLLTVTWDNQTRVTSDGDKPHDASASWTEDVSTRGFKACVMVAGRHFFDHLAPPSVFWVAYQDGVATTTDDLEAGTVNMKTWYSGSRCHFITLKKHTPNTKVLVSVEHGRPRVYTNAMTAWVEKGKFGNDSMHVCKVCARELQNFDGAHKDIKIHYLAMHGPIDRYIVEPNEIKFERHHFSRDQPIPPVCKTVKFNYNFPMLPNPTVILTGVNVSKMHSNSVFSRHDISAWMEGNNDTHISVCFKSLRAGLYREQVTVQYAIWPTLCPNGWVHFNGNCYNGNNTQRSYQNAGQHCASSSAALPESKMSAAKAYFFRKMFSEWVWLQQNNDGICRFSIDENGVTPCDSTTVADCSNNLGSDFVCQKDSGILTNGCNCENSGSCYQDALGKFRCHCTMGYIGKRCEKQINRNCMYYTNMTDAMVPHLSPGVWYRYPARKMVEYCPRRRGCASLDNAHPRVSEGVVTRNMIFGGFPHVKEGQCTKDYGKIMVQNCGDYYVYNVHSVNKKELGTELCFEKHTVPSSTV